MATPFVCPACGHRLPDAVLATGSTRTSCPSCGATLILEVRVAADVPVSAGGPPLSAEARLAALGETTSAPPRGRMAGVRRFAGLLVCVLLLLGPIAQHATFRTATWIEDARLRPVIEGVCAYLHCRPPLPRDPAYLRIVDRRVGPLPGRPGALRVELVFQNTAPFAMPPPCLQLTFYDALRRPVAGRRFRPREYLPESLDPARPLDGGQAVHTRLDIVDPGPSALGFEFSFVYGCGPLEGAAPTQ